MADGLLPGRQAMAAHIDDAAMAFLNSLKSAEFAHLNRRARDHLIGVHALLAQWGNHADVCLAGLFHNIYGTEFFKPEAVSLDQRSEVASVIGSAAETLAYYFCISKRASFFARQDPAAPTIWDELHKQRVAVTPAQLAALIEIEAANLVDQYAVELHAYPDKLGQAVAMVQWMLAQPSPMGAVPRQALHSLLARIEQDRRSLAGGHSGPENASATPHL